MEDLVFVGSEATGYYSGAHSIIGVFVGVDYYEKHKVLFSDAFEYLSHGEIDGKHSDVMGDLVTVGFNTVEGVTSFIGKKSVDYEIYNFTERVDEGITDGLFAHLEGVYKRVEENMDVVNTYEFVLTDDEFEVVSELIKELRKGSR